MVEVTDMLIEMSEEIPAILEILLIQALAKEEMLEMLEIKEMQLAALTNLVLLLLKWLGCLPRSLDCPSHPRCNN